jgi:hypothetical protein
MLWLTGDLATRVQYRYCLEVLRGPTIKTFTTQYGRTCFGTEITDIERNSRSYVDERLSEKVSALDSAKPFSTKVAVLIRFTNFGVQRGLKIDTIDTIALLPFIPPRDMGEHLPLHHNTLTKALRMLNLALSRDP